MGAMYLVRVSESQDILDLMLSTHFAQHQTHSAVRLLGACAAPKLELPWRAGLGLPTAPNTRNCLINAHTHFSRTHAALRIEEDVLAFIGDTNRDVLEFPQNYGNYQVRMENGKGACLHPAVLPAN
eukprot:705964-Pelagomonas_calceolata.AAC.2